MKFMNANLLVLVLFSIMTFPTLANKKAHNHSRIGSHGMVLFSDGAHLFASHLPLYYKPHDYQLIYQVESSDKQVIINYLNENNVKDSGENFPQMVTILPQTFDLNKLINQEPLSIAATVFKGHFERGGLAWLKESTFRFTELVLKKQLPDKPKLVSDTLVTNSGVTNTFATNHANFKHQWQIINLDSSNSKLFVHLINEKPSFDAIVLGKGCLNKTNALQKHSQALPKEIAAQLSLQCEQQSILYLETQDFSE